MQYYLQGYRQNTARNPLETALTQEISQYKLPEVILPGVYAGYDPAKDRDRSGFIIIAKDVPKYGEVEPKLRVRMKKDFRGINFSDQIRQIIELDKQYPITCLAMDITRHEDTWERIHDHFGPRSRGIKFTPASKANMITSTRILFQDSKIELDSTHSYHALLRKELYELDPSTLKHPKTASGSDDMAWALALAVSAVVQEERDNVDSGFGTEQLIF